MTVGQTAANQGFAASANPLIRGLENPGAYDHPVRDLRLIETHISWIVLTGDYAYKIKKPVDFGFLDFSTLEKRQFYCLEELRLNRRFAPDLYLDLVEIRGSDAAPLLHGDGKVIEYAVRMRQFDQRDLLSAHAARGSLDGGLVDRIARRISEIHAACPPAPADSAYGSVAVVKRWCEENLVHLDEAIPAEFLPPAYHRLGQWYRQNRDIGGAIDARKADGFVRECHGDLHLGNMALIDGQVTLFDCIEFNPELRWIDTISEAAFVAMDLQARGYPGYCWRFLNRYLEFSGDYAAIRLLRYYFVYRALVRAKVEALRVDQEALTGDTYREHLQSAFDYLDLGDSWAQADRVGMILMHGLSGSGKSTVAAQLVESLGAIQLRSDVERKRLFEIDATASSGSTLDGGIYTADASERTYRRLAELARIVVDAGYCVIVDATFLHAAQRRLLLELETGGPCRRVIVDCDAPVDELERRIESREGDASEANLAVLRRQLETREAIGEDELARAKIVMIGSNGAGPAQVERIRSALFS